MEIENKDWRVGAARSSLERLIPRMESKYARALSALPQGQWKGFQERLENEWVRLFGYLHGLYGWQYDFFYTLERVLDMMVSHWLDRPIALHALDKQRLTDPLWYTSEQVSGIVLYVDLFSDNLAGLRESLPYLEKLGITYLHLMPPFAVPHGENDGGYAISDYRSLHPDIGTMEELAELADELCGRGISLVLDFVFNHTSDDHRWARRAREGDPEYRDYYHTFTDRAEVDRYQAHLRDIFPEARRGSFTWCEELQRWVWTTFNSYQWDLNYSNPAVFCDMAAEMLFLSDPGKFNDSRWVHRSRKKWRAHDDLSDPDTLEWKFFSETAKLFHLRKETPAFRNGGMKVVDSGNPHLFAYTRSNAGQRLLVVNNFSEFEQTMPGDRLAAAGITADAHRIYFHETLPIGDDLVLDGYGFAWINIP